MVPLNVVIIFLFALSYINIQFFCHALAVTTQSTIISIASVTRWNKRKRILKVTQNNSNNDDDSNRHHEQLQIKNKNINKRVYTAPTFSKSFMEHVSRVKGEDNNDTEEGVDCTGEPSIDPSRRVQDDGLDSEYLFDYFENKKDDKMTREEK